jgi:signal transduction histidine kinase
VIDFLCKESLPRRVARHLSFFSPRFEDLDRVAMLRHHPLGMFFYNLRFLVFLTSGVVLLISIIAGAPDQARDFFWHLAAIWLLGVILTLGLHSSFRVTLNQWAQQIGSDSLPGAFHRYFVLDSALVILVFFVGRLTRPEQAFDAFCWLLLANTIVYAGYDLGAMRRRNAVVLVLPVAVGIILLLDYDGSTLPRWLAVVLEIGPIVATCILSVFAVHTITRARRLDAIRVDKYMTLLGELGVRLAPPEFETAAIAQRGGDHRDYREKEYRGRLIEALRLVCSSEHFWFRSGCLWVVERHHDRGDVLIPTAYYNLPLKEYGDGIEAHEGFLNDTEPALVRSLEATVRRDPSAVHRWRFKLTEDIPAAMIPVVRDDRKIGVLVLYGERDGVPVVASDRTFLLSLAATIGGVLEQWETFLRALALDELDALFACDSIDSLLQQANRLLKRCLSARGCMIVYRGDSDRPTMTVSAIEGFRSSMLGSTYDVAIGLTGKCAESGKIKRVDDVRLHVEEFDPKLLRRLEREHQASVTSWMAIPIGVPPNNYGVIKVVNSLYPCRWFTAFDERLGTDIAVRLRVMIEKIRHFERTEVAKKDALRNEANAVAAQRRAENTAERREQDIMTVMHQLQAPLLAISNALTAMDTGELSSFNSDMVQYATLLVDDAIASGFGTVTVFAKEAGRETLFQETEIDAASELAGLARRLQRTQKREDLTFRFHQDPDFPRLRMDAAVFASVFYSLIHNAMKYADEGSEVDLECGFEVVPGTSVRRPALKVKTVGEPIGLRERERVFEKFVRGHGVERGKLYKGVGLGLWVARRLMEMLGGSLSLELSREHPKRSVFVVYIPGGEQ